MKDKISKWACTDPFYSDDSHPCEVSDEIVWWKKNPRHISGSIENCPSLFKIGFVAIPAGQCGPNVCSKTSKRFRFGNLFVWTHIVFRTQNRTVLISSFQVSAVRISNANLWWSLSLYRIAYSSMIQSIAPIIFHSKCRELQKFWAARGKMSACLCETTLIMMTPNVGNFSRKHFWMHSNTTWEMSHLCMKRWCTVGVGQKWWETTHGKLAFLNNELLKRGRLNGRTLSFHLTVVICVVHKLKVNRFWLRRGFKI